MLRRSICLVVSLAVFGSGHAIASDLWAVRVGGDGPTIDTCNVTEFTSSLLLINKSREPATVSLLGVSSGAGKPFTSTVVVPAMRSFAASADRGVLWGPAVQSLAWVIHLDVPDLLLVRNRLDLRVRAICVVEPGLPNLTPQLGRAELPVFRELVPAGVEQDLVGIDNGSVDSDVHVFVYNAGTTTASASVAIRNACDDSIVEQHSMAVASNSTAEIIIDSQHMCVPIQTPFADTWSLNAAISVDQPSISFALAIARKSPHFNSAAYVGVTSTAPQTLMRTRRHVARGSQE